MKTEKEQPKRPSYAQHIALTAERLMREAGNLMAELIQITDNQGKPLPPDSPFAVGASFAMQASEIFRAIMGDTQPKSLAVLFVAYPPGEPGTDSADITASGFGRAREDAHLRLLLRAASEISAGAQEPNTPKIVLPH